MGIDLFRFDRKRALVVGGATGMGAATAKLLGELGAEVIVADIAAVDFPVAKALKLDLRDLGSIRQLLDDAGAPIHALFMCAGVSDEIASPMDVMQINFIGQRCLIEMAIARGMLPEGSAISMIASIGGLGWDRRLTTTKEFLACATPDEQVRWLEAHADLQGYQFSKEAVITYCKWKAPEFLRKGIRINAIGPGPTRTPLMAKSASWGGFADFEFEKVMGHPASTPEEQAYPLVFLASAAASHVSGQVLHVDAGYTGGGQTGAVETALVPRLAPPIS